MSTSTKSFNRLIQIMDELREKCPWDKKQTIQTLRSLTIEETYELADAITQNDWKGIKEELGDMLLHIVFYARIATEQQQFTLTEVIETLCIKLIHRHPHIYSNVQADTEEEVKRNWENLKLKEGKAGVLSGVPKALPAMIKATRIQEKVKQVGFEWSAIEEVYKKVEEEIKELQEAVVENDPTHIEEEWGDVVFSLINYARFLKIDPETALEKINQKFIHRFNAMEKRAFSEGKNLQEMTLTEMDSLWATVKQENRETKAGT